VRPQGEPANWRCVRSWA